ncbi:hypothetical protein SOVF_058970 [Spinacia oleracea]|nr:hypothetical protein SOVF_058970 [Spinacia oleracea]
MYNKCDNIDRGGEVVLKIKAKDKKRVLVPYIQHIYKVVDEIEQKKKELRVYLNRFSGENGVNNINPLWRSFPFVNPSSFDNIVLDNEVKSKVKNDLELFLKSKHYYNKIGRVWKRSYLLYGGSGTGKSTFVAAMAKFLSYDLYDIDLSKPFDGSGLKMLLLQTTRKSLILIENLDWYLMGNSNGVSLSTILNFMDGVVSSCGEERVMVFTMNCKNHIDPLVIRPGRVDVHIHFPFCDFNGFKGLALSHLGCKEHKLFSQVEDLIQQNGPRLSPAEISEIMISHRSSPSRAIKTIIKALQSDDGKPPRYPSGQAVGVLRARVSPFESEDGKPINCVEQQLNVSGKDQVLEELDGESKGKRDGYYAIREIQKMYGRLRLKNGSRGESFDLS